VTDSLVVGGTIDYLWGGLDIQMQMDGATFGAFTQQTSRLGYASGAMVNTLGSMIGQNPGQIGDVNWAHFDFSEGGNKMKQRLTTTGWAGNLGFVWKASPQLSIGGVYHAKSHLDDMEGNGTLSMNVAMNGGPSGVTIPVSGKLKVMNFQWPETYGIGLAYQATSQLMIAADYKRIGWAGVMKNFTMNFTADGSASNGPLAGQSMTAVLFQNWKNQDVFVVGASYKVSDPLVVRGGVSLANNPIPNDYMNPLFPAIEKNHVMAGLGYAFSKTASVDLSFTYAPEVTATNSVSGVTTKHSQTNWNAMYSHRF
jgi:long-chain fatty acid transport protein